MAEHTPEAIKKESVILKRKFAKMGLTLILMGIIILILSYVTEESQVLEEGLIGFLIFVLRSFGFLLISIGVVSILKGLNLGKKKTISQLP